MQRNLLAFEYGVIFSESAKTLKKKLTPEMVKKAEEMITNEFESKTDEELARDMHVNILSVFETKTTK